MASTPSRPLPKRKGKPSHLGRHSSTMIAWEVKGLELNMARTSVWIYMSYDAATSATVSASYKLFPAALTIQPALPRESVSVTWWSDVRPFMSRRSAARSSDVYGDAAMPTKLASGQSGLLREQKLRSHEHTTTTSFSLGPSTSRKICSTHPTRDTAVDVATNKGAEHILTYQDSPCLFNSN